MKVVVPLPALLLSAGVTAMATPLLGLTVVTVNTKVDGGGGVEVELPPPPQAKSDRRYILPRQITALRTNVIKLFLLIPLGNNRTPL
jgi:hypothetical protein